MKRLISIALAALFAVALYTRAQTAPVLTPAQSAAQTAQQNAFAADNATTQASAAQNAQLNGQIAQLSGQIAQLQGQLATATQPTQHTGFLGTNLTTSTYYTPQVHADLCRQSSGFYNVGDATPGTLNANGYPVGTAIHMRSQNWLEDCPAGTYQFTCTGTGTFKLSVYGPGTWTQTGPNSGTLVLPQAGTATTQPATNTPTLILWIDVTSSSPTNPLGNFHLWQPGYGPGSANPNAMFTLPYTKLLGRYSCLRLMNSTCTPSNADVLPSDRVQQSYYDQEATATPTGKGEGECIEDLIELCRETGVKKVWYCVPANANAAYQQQVLQLFHDGLPGVTIVLEFSDEPWNSAGFNAYPVIWNLGNNSEPAAYDGTYNAAGQFVPTPATQPLQTNGLVRAMRAAADLEYQLYQNVAPIFADNPARLQCVLSSQAGMSQWASEGLAFVKGKYGSIPFKALIEAPYFNFWPLPFNNQTVPTGPNGTYLLSDLMSGTWNDFQTVVVPDIQAHQALATQWGILHYLYESGPSTLPQPNTNPVNDLSYSLVTSPEFGTEVSAYFSLAHGLGVNMAMDFCIGPGYWNQYGYWPTCQSITATDFTGPTATNYRFAAEQQIISLWN